MRERVGEREQMLKQSGRRPKNNSGKTALAFRSLFGRFDTELKCSAVEIDILFSDYLWKLINA